MCACVCAFVCAFVCGMFMRKHVRVFVHSGDQFHCLHIGSGGLDYAIDVVALHVEMMGKIRISPVEVIP